MGTHPIFESDFDCLTENNRNDRKKEKMEERSNFKMPRRTFRLLTLNGVTTVAVHDHLTLLDAISKCNRLRDIDVTAARVIQPATGVIGNLEDQCALYADALLMLRTDDASYIAATQQHAFNRRLKLKAHCSECDSGPLWLRRLNHCRLCLIRVCARCRKRGAFPPCTASADHHRHFVEFNAARFRG